MASLTTTFRSTSERVHEEHHELIDELADLDAALDELVCYSEVYANLAAAERVCRCGHYLAELLPQHFGQEEATLLTTVAKVSPELADFAREMRQQHESLRVQLRDFCRAVEDLEAGNDIDATVTAVKERGKVLARELTNHVALEENQLGGFLG